MRDNAGIGGGVGARAFSKAIGCGVGGRFAGSTAAIGFASGGDTAIGCGVGSVAIGCGVGLRFGEGAIAAIGCGVGVRFGSTASVAIGCGVGLRFGAELGAATDCGAEAFAAANGGENGANVGSAEGSEVARGFFTQPFVTAAAGAAVGFATVAFGFVAGGATVANVAVDFAAALSVAAVAAPGGVAGWWIGVPIAWVLRLSGIAGATPVRRSVFVVVRGFAASLALGSSQPSSSCLVRTGPEFDEADCFTNAARFDSIACGVC